MDRKIDRRSFLKIAGLSAGLSIPFVSGYSVYNSAKGEFPQLGLPYEVEPDPVAQSPVWSGQPILLLRGNSTTNPFSAYYEEILLAEGFHGFDTAPAQSVGTDYLRHYKIVIVPEGVPSQFYRDLLFPYVQDGGRILAMRPERELAPFFGLSEKAGELSDGYVRISPDVRTREDGRDELLRFYGSADPYTAPSAQVLAWIQSNPSGAADASVAVGVARPGNGKAAIWAFDLATSVVFNRQGNPLFADQPDARWDGVRAINLYRGMLDLDTIHIPQADELQRLFGHVLHILSEGSTPLPRIWYFPETAASVLIATSDSHMNPGESIEEVLSTVESFGGKATIYYSPEPNQQLRRGVKRLSLRMKSFPIVGDYIARRVVSPSQSDIENWRTRGHEIALHPWVEEGLEPGWSAYWREFTGLGYGEIPPTARTHRVLWKGWTETAEFQAALGIRMNYDFYHWGSIFQKENGDWKFGHFTGSGRPMKFIDAEGRILEIYQQLTQLADDHILNLHWGGVAKLSPEEGIRIAKEMIADSIKGSYCAIGTNFHTDPFAIGGDAKEKAAAFMNGVLAYCSAQDVPITSALDWYEFTENRHSAALTESRWNQADRQFACSLECEPSSLGNMSIQLPARFDGLVLKSVEVNGEPIAVTERMVGGVAYGSVILPERRNRIQARYAE